jgi:hypothetical protein
MHGGSVAVEVAGRTVAPGDVCTLVWDGDAFAFQEAPSRTINTPGSLRAVPINQCQGVVVLTQPPRTYRYNPTSAATDDGDTAIVPSAAPSLGRWERVSEQQPGRWLTLEPNVAATTFAVIGAASSVAVGTPTLRTPANTNTYTRRRRVAVVSAATAGALASFRHPIQSFDRNQACSFEWEFGVSDAATVANARMFIGLLPDANAPTNVEPSSRTNMVGFGLDAADTNLSFMINDNAGVATKVALGASFPGRTLSADWYQTRIYWDANITSSVSWSIRNLVTGAFASGLATTDLPQLTAFLAFNSWRTNNATALAVAIDFGRLSSWSAA